MSPLTASLQILEEHPSIRLGPSNIMDSKETALLLSGAVLGKALGGSSHAHKCRDHAHYFAFSPAGQGLHLLFTLFITLFIFYVNCVYLLLFLLLFYYYKKNS